MYVRRKDSSICRRSNSYLNTWNELKTTYNGKRYEIDMLIVFNRVLAETRLITLVLEKRNFVKIKNLQMPIRKLLMDT